jgi:hypothetical protein
MKLLFILIILITCISKAQTETEWFPGELNIRPFTANLFEPGAGFSYLLGQRKLRLDIGYSSDVLLIRSGNKFISAGGDFFTFTRLREAENFHFPVEAVDYFFGINAGYKTIKSEIEYGFRLRFSHISAHLADGRYDKSSGAWIDEQLPRVYSREFLELFPFYSFKTFRIYTGLTYLLHVIPSNIGKGIYQLGFDYYFTDLINPSVIPFIAYNLKISEERVLTGSNTVSAGIKFGNYNSGGISIILGYYSGKSVHGEFFEYNEDYFTAGLIFIL